MATRTLIPLINAYKKCCVVENTTKLHNDVLAGKIKIEKINGHDFVFKEDVTSYFSEDAAPPKPTETEISAWVKEVKANSTFFNQNQ